MVVCPMPEECDDEVYITTATADSGNLFSTKKDHYRSGQSDNNKFSEEPRYFKTFANNSFEYYTKFKL